MLAKPRFICLGGNRCDIFLVSNRRAGEGHEAKAKANRAAKESDAHDKVYAHRSKKGTDCQNRFWKWNLPGSD